MRILLAILLVLGAHFSLTANVPAQAGKAWLLWPFGADSSARLDLPRPTLDILTRLLSALAAFGFLAALLSLFGLLIPATWLVPLVAISSVLSILLYALYFRRWAVLPILVDLLLLSGVLIPGWMLPAPGSAGKQMRVTAIPFDSADNDLIRNCLL